MDPWEDLTKAFGAVDLSAPTRSSVKTLSEVVTGSGLLTADPLTVPEEIVQAVAAVDRTWVTQLAQDPDVSQEKVDEACSACERLRAAHGSSVLPLHYARVEILGVLGLRDDAIEQLRVARLFSFAQSDTSAVLAIARMHDDYSGVIRTTTAVSSRAEADPAATARNLGASLLPYLAHGRRVEAEDAFASLRRVDLPAPARLYSLGDQLEYLGLSSQWQRALALLRHTDLSSTYEATAWEVMHAAVGLSLVLRQACRADYGRNALGASLEWETPWATLSMTGWDTVAHAYDLTTAFVRAIALRFDQRNGNNGVSHRVETRMAAEATRLASRSYGTVTGDVLVDPARVRNQPALLSEVRELLTLVRGYGLEPVRDRAISTAEVVSTSLAEVTDDSALEMVVDLRLAFARLLSVLGANERAERENLDTAGLCVSTRGGQRRPVPHWRSPPTRPRLVAAAPPARQPGPGALTS